jgi:hypothetical protein
MDLFGLFESGSEFGDWGFIGALVGWIFVVFVFVE